VLVAEDVPTNRRVVEVMLRRLGAEAVLAGEGAEAVRLAGESAFDAILMDCQMPGMDGFEATRRIRAGEAGARVPIIALTANATRGDRDLCLAAGMDDFVSKPIELRDLQRILAHWLAAAPEPATTR
jgi:CheY-like chemotaxis protein